MSPREDALTHYTLYCTMRQKLWRSKDQCPGDVKSRACTQTPKGTLSCWNGTVDLTAANRLYTHDVSQMTKQFNICETRPIVKKTTINNHICYVIIGVQGTYPVPHFPKPEFLTFLSDDMKRSWGPKVLRSWFSDFFFFAFWKLGYRVRTLYPDVGT